MWRYVSSDELYHHGVLGMKWGIRRYQNKDGSYTAAGKARYIKDQTKAITKDINSFKSAGSKGSGFNKKDHAAVIKGLTDVKRKQEAKASQKWDKKVAKEEKKKDNSGKGMSTQKKVLIGAGITAGVLAGAYGAYKISKNSKQKAENGKKIIDDFMKIHSDTRVNAFQAKSKQIELLNTDSHNVKDPVLRLKNQTRLKFDIADINAKNKASIDSAMNTLDNVKKNKKNFRKKDIRTMNKILDETVRDEMDSLIDQELRKITGKNYY